jgi:DNA-directed RNA polymerase subunit M/transcription elongation factor TFIIS
MPFSIVCPNKGCNQLMEPYLDPSSDLVYCSSCDKEINNVTHFIKLQMKQFKQFRQKKTVSFGVKCKNCNIEDRPVVSNKQIICPSCKKPHLHLSEAFKLMLKDNLQKINKDI